VEGGSVAFGGLLCYRARFAFGAGVIDSHIQTTKPGHGLIDQLAHIVFVAHIGPHKFSFRAEFPEFANQILSFFIMSPRNNNGCALLREGKCGGSANTCQRAGDQNNWCSHFSSPRRSSLTCFSVTSVSPFCSC